MAPKVTTSRLIEMKRARRPITALTAYDAPMAALLSGAGIDVILVGDSVANVKLGYENTIPVTFEEMLHHVKAVHRGNASSLLVADMPYLSYEIDPKEAARFAGRFMKEGGAEAVKVEGGQEMLPAVREILRVNVPVMGHLGLTPQSVNRLGGYKLQGKRPEEMDKMLRDAQALEKAGAFSIVLECIPADLAAEITKTVSIPTIGIGAGPDCDGQILVIDDLLGLSAQTPKFVKRYAELGAQAAKAVADYAQDVRGRRFPADEHSYHLSKEAKNRS